MSSRLTVVDGQMRIALSKDEIDIHLAAAIKKANKYQNIQGLVSPYGFNHAHSHFVGAVAEYASFILFEEIEKLLNLTLNIDPAFNNEARDSECDLYVNDLRIEVKCVKYGSWIKYGPCVSTKQLEKIEKKADIILWAVFNEKTNCITFKGFNYVDHIRPCIKKVMTGPVGKQVENYPVLDLINSLQELKL